MPVVSALAWTSFRTAPPSAHVKTLGALGLLSCFKPAFVVVGTLSFVLACLLGMSFRHSFMPIKCCLVAAHASFVLEAASLDPCMCLRVVASAQEEAEWQAALQLLLEMGRSHLSKVFVWAASLQNIAEPELVPLSLWMSPATSSGLQTERWHWFAGLQMWQVLDVA